MKHNALALCAAAVLICFPMEGNCKKQPTLEERVESTLSQLTLQEKLKLIHAQSKFSSAGVPRLGIPEFWTDDGPHGCRPDVLWDEWDQAGCTNDSCTAYPALTALAATWNRDLSLLYGQSIGEEFRYRGKDMLLGPGINIFRTPYNGRNFEYMGEDPFLAAEMVVPYVQGVQVNGVAACVKHYALNNQELNRHTTDVHLSDRTLYEIYLPAFRAAVQKGGALGIMASYNLYNGQYACHNERLLNDILKGEWGFKGVVVSDWGGTHDTDEAIRNGLDMEFGSWTDGLSEGLSNAYDNYYLANPYYQRIVSGEVGTEELDDKVRRVLRVIFQTAMNEEAGFGRFTCPEHYAAARKIGAEGIVLLKNEGSVLPIRDDVKKILVVGENAVKMMTVGGGSSSLKVQHEISPLQGIQERYPDAEVVYQRGYVGDVSGSYNGVTSGQDLKESRSAEELIADAVAAAKDADYVIFVGGLNKSYQQDCEGGDRISYELPYEQDKAIAAVAAANSNFVYVNVSGNPVAMPWIDSVPAVLQAWFLGSEAGHSLVDVLSGDVNPSGKLPYTYPVAYEDGPIRSVEQYPGIPRESKYASMPEAVYEETYSEGIFVGYRWFDKQEIAPLFPFGHGLSYTSFSFDNLKLSKSSIKAAGDYAVDAQDEKTVLKVSVKLTNTGDCAGAEVVQLYLSDTESPVERPVRELKGFDKIHLESGESAVVSIELTAEDFAYFNEDAHCWTVHPGTYTVSVGNSSRNILASAEVKVK